MLDLIILSVTIGFIVVAAWLYLSTKKREARIGVDARALPEASLRTFLIPSPTKSERLYRKMKGFFVGTMRIALRFAVIILPLVLIVSAVYLAITDGASTFLIILLALLGLTLLGWWLLLPQRRYYPNPARPAWATPGVGSEKTEAPPRIVRYDGWARIPMKVYEGDSYNITIDLRPSKRGTSANRISVRFRKAEDRNDISVDLKVLQHSGRQEYLELEILAAGFAIEGDRKQRQALDAASLYYQWNCFFENSGCHTFALAFRVISDSSVQEIGHVEQSVKVVKIDHLTQRQVWVLATAAGIISGSLAILEVVKALGLW